MKKKKKVWIQVRAKLLGSVEYPWARPRLIDCLLFPRLFHHAREAPVLSGSSYLHLLKVCFWYIQMICRLLFCFFFSSVVAFFFFLSPFFLSLTSLLDQVILVYILLYLPNYLSIYPSLLISDYHHYYPDLSASFLEMKNSIPSDVWEKKRALIAKLYKDEEWPLKQVIKQIRAEDFNPR